MASAGQKSMFGWLLPPTPPDSHQTPRNPHSTHSASHQQHSPRQLQQNTPRMRSPRLLLEDSPRKILEVFRRCGSDAFSDGRQRSPLQIAESTPRPIWDMLRRSSSDAHISCRCLAKSCSVEDGSPKVGEESPGREAEKENTLAHSSSKGVHVGFDIGDESKASREPHCATLVPPCDKGRHNDGPRLAKHGMDKDMASLPSQTSLSKGKGPYPLLAGKGKGTKVASTGLEAITSPMPGEASGTHGQGLQSATIGSLKGPLPGVKGRQSGPGPSQAAFSKGAGKMRPRPPSPGGKGAGLMTPVGLGKAPDESALGSTGCEGLPAPKGKGKGKAAVLGTRALSAPNGKGKPIGAVPTRFEKEAWLHKTKNNLRWQRRLRGQGGVETSVFGIDEEPVDLVMLERYFAREVLEEPKVLRIGVSFIPRERVEGQILWEATDKQDPRKRRTNITILMKTWERSANAFLERLGRLELDSIVSGTDFNEDLFEQLIVVVKSVTTVEWTRLQESDAETKYAWDWQVEGFFRRLQAISYFQQRLMGLHIHLMVERDLRKLSVRVTQVGAGVRAIRQSEGLRLALRKILHIGNCLNAGSAPLGRADGFDAVHVLERAILIDMPKGSDGKTSLLQYIKEKELSSGHRQAFGELAKQLQGWKIPSESDDADDPTDISELQKSLHNIAAELSRLEKELADAIQRHVVSLEALSCLGGTTGSERSKGQHLETQLGTLEGYAVKVKEHRLLIHHVDAELEQLRDELVALHEYLLHMPMPKKRFSAGRVLGVMAAFAQRLAPEKNRPVGAARRGTSLEPEPTRTRDVSEPRRRSASVDSILTMTTIDRFSGSRPPCIDVSEDPEILEHLSPCRSPGRRARIVAFARPSRLR